jgi:3-aminobutyryl-CoA ammonia-lyase
MEAFLRVRLGLHDTHYPNGLIPAATILRLFADCSGEIGVKMDGVDGYLAAYENAEFLLPVYAGDYLEVRAKLETAGNRSRRIGLQALRCTEHRDLGGGLSGGIFHDPPQLVARAIMIAVKPKDSEAAGATATGPS